MRLPALLILCLLAARLPASAWGVDVGLVGGIGVNGFWGAPAGLDPAKAALPVQVKAGSSLGLLGQAGFEVAVSRKRRWMLSLQPSWLGQSRVMREDLDLLGVPLQRKTTWEWQSFLLPLELSYAHPLHVAPKSVLMGRLGAGAWYAGTRGPHKTLSSGVGDPVVLPWNAPPDDWGPLLGLGLDWIELPRHSRRVSVELRAQRGTALLDEAAGAGLPGWGLEFLFAVPLYAWGI